MVTLTSIELLFIVLLSGLAALSLLAAGTLALVSRHRFHPTWPLAAIFILLAILALARVLGAFDVFTVLPVARAVFLPLLFVTAPLLLWFGRSMLAVRPAFESKQLVHTVPALVVLAVFVVMYGDQDGLGASMRRAIGDYIGTEVGVDDVVRATYWLFFLHWTVYAAAVVRAQIRGFADRRRFFSGMDEAVERRMRYVLLFVTVPWASLVVQYAVSSMGYPRASNPAPRCFASSSWGRSPFTRFARRGSSR